MLPKVAEVVGAYLRRSGINVPYLPYFEKIQEYMSWFRGKSDWHEYRQWNGKKKIKRQRYALDMAKTVCEDLASLIGVERLDIHFNDEEAKKFVLNVLEENKFKTNGSQLIELTQALGSGAFVPSFQTETGKIVIDYIHGDLIFPLKWDNGKVEECAFAIVGGDNAETAYQLLIHKKNEQGVYVVQKINLDVNGAIARPSELANHLNDSDLEVEEWNTGLTTPSFVFFKTNIVNNYDKTSPLGMSVFGNSIDILKSIDEAFDSLNNEFALGKKRIFIKSGLKTIRIDDESFRDSIYNQIDVNDVAFYQVDWAGEHEDKPPIYESNMTLRIAEHQQGLDMLVKLLGRKCGLGDGFYSFDGTNIARTATEVISINSSLFRNIRKQELAIADAVKQLCTLILEIANRNGLGAFDVNQDITINFDDSIIEDSAKEKQDAMAEYNAGLIDQVEYFAITRKMTREQAEQFVAKMQATDTLKQVDSILNNFSGGI